MIIFSKRFLAGMILNVLDEEAHAEQIKLAMRLAEEGVFSGKRVPEGNIDQLLNRVRSIVRGVETQSPSVGDALRVSMKLEEDFGQVHALAALEFVNTGMETVFRRLARADEEHVNELKTYYRKHFGTL